MINTSDNVTQLLRAWAGGDPEALDKLTPLVYAELHRLAVRSMAAERPDHTLQPTALVHEAYVRLMSSKDVVWKDRAHFFALSARLMRRILVDFARSRQSEKRGRGDTPMSLEEITVVSPQKAPYLMALDDALTRLAEVDARKSDVVELRFFGGMSVEETAEVLKVSRDTVLRDWKMARLWLLREISTLMFTNPERWQQIENLCLETLERESDERAGFLDAACAGDADLRREVESLLKYAEPTDDPLDRSTGEGVTQLVPRVDRTNSAPRHDHRPLLH